MRTALLAALIAAALPLQAQEAPQAELLRGLKQPDLARVFNSHAKADKDALIELRGCSTKPSMDRKAQAWICETGFGAGVLGTADLNGRVKTAAIHVKPDSIDSLDRFRRGARYLVRATKGGLVIGDGTLVSNLLAAASKAPGTLQATRDGGLSFYAVKEADGAWEFGVEPVVAGQ